MKCGFHFEKRKKKRKIRHFYSKVVIISSFNLLVQLEFDGNCLHNHRHCYVKTSNHNAKYMK